MFLTFSCISQHPNKYINSNKIQIYQNPNSQYPTKKKSSNQRSTQNQRVSGSATRSTQRRIDPEQVDRWFGGTILGGRFGFVIWGMGSTDELDDLRNGFNGRARRSKEWVHDLMIGALLDERAQSWVFWVRWSSWMWIDLAFAGAGCWCDLSSVLSLSLSFSRSLSLLRVTRKWFEGKMKV